VLIVQNRFCPAFMVPVAEFEPGAVCVQSFLKTREPNPRDRAVSVTVKEPGPNTIVRCSGGLPARKNVDGSNMLFLCSGLI
jgi:hypothetical protein